MKQVLVLSPLQPSMKTMRIWIAFLLFILTMAAVPALADQSDPRLDRLFLQLLKATTPPEAQGVEKEIQSLWLRSGSDTVDVLMARAQASIEAQDVPTAKKLLVLSLSLIETTLQAVDRARAALIAAGIITRGFSWRNLRNGWLLVQTVWLTVVTIALGRTPSDFVLDSYRGLFIKHRDEYGLTGANMVFTSE